MKTTYFARRLPVMLLAALLGTASAFAAPPWAGGGGGGGKSEEGRGHKQERKARQAIAEIVGSWDHVTGAGALE